MDEAKRRIEAVFRIEWARLVAGLARFVRGDLGTAEELAQDALVAALETWRQDGIPREPGAWLMQVAKNRARKRIDRQKRWEKNEIALTQAIPSHHSLLDRHVRELRSLRLTWTPREGGSLCAHENVRHGISIAG